MTARVEQSRAWQRDGDRSAAASVARRSAQPAVGPEAEQLFHHARLQGRSEAGEAYGADALAEVVRRGRGFRCPSRRGQAMLWVTRGDRAETTRAMQHEGRRSVATLQHGGGDASGVELPLTTGRPASSRSRGVSRGGCVSALVRSPFSTR